MTNFVSTVHFEASDSDGNVINSTFGSGPVHINHGTSGILKRIDDIVLHMKIGECRTIEVGPEDAYGKHDPLMIKEVPKDWFPELSGDETIEAASEASEQFRIIASTEDSHIVDFNHPLAGKHITYKLEVIGREERKKGAKNVVFLDNHRPARVVH